MDSYFSKEKMNSMDKRRKTSWAYRPRDANLEALTLNVDG
jgi:hypothetical protein